MASRSSGNPFQCTSHLLRRALLLFPHTYALNSKSSIVEHTLYGIVSRLLLFVLGSSVLHPFMYPSVVHSSRYPCSYTPMILVGAIGRDATPQDLDMFPGEENLVDAH